MGKVTAVIIDDELNALELVGHYVNQFFGEEIEVKAKFQQPMQALQYLKDEKVDLVFLDINMPNLTGMEFLGLLPNRSFEVIFITAYANYAIEAYKNKALAYLLKPIDRLAFVEAVETTIVRIVKMKGSTVRADDCTERIAVKEKGVNKIISTNDILYLKAEGSYTKVFTEEKAYILSKNLKHSCTCLPEEDFLKINRSYVVNMRHIQAYTKKNGGSVFISNKIELGISKGQRAVVFLSLAEKINRI
ncbi:MAG: response regulator transcription factor [Flavobacteriales bacterium]|nr:response regulator transcription factor [Flavobacteriales bacterium]